MENIRISVVGLGYVGLTTAVAFASAGFNVNGYDVDREKVEKINNSYPTLYEPGLSSLLRKAIRNGFKIFRREVLRT